MPAPSSSLDRFWQCDQARNILLSHLVDEDLASLRLVAVDFAEGVAAKLFSHLRINFRSTTFTRHARIAALERIGRHVRTFDFVFPHTDETALAPLIDSVTGETVEFVYEPYTQINRDPSSRLSLPCYGSWEVTDLLVRQYPPLFHAAANVPSFIRALALVPNIRHVVVSCPMQKSAQRYRRSIVDYALISLRLAIERNQCTHLRSMSLLDVHPAATLYLNPRMGFGALPSSQKRWRQVRHLKLRISSTVADGESCQDYLKLLHSYMDVFSMNLQRLDFAWLGERDICPVTPLRNHPDSSVRDSVRCLWPSFQSNLLQPLEFPRLRELKTANTFAEASGVASFISSHRRAVCNTRRLRLKFDDTILRSGSWDEALEPLTQISGSDSWKSSEEEGSNEPIAEESMEVPIMFSLGHDKDDELHQIWNDRFHRSPRLNHGRLSSLQRAGARTKELLFGTEEHMRRIFSSTVLSWR